MTLTKRQPILPLALATLALLIMMGCEEKSPIDDAAQALIDARDAVEAGDSAKAMELLDASIAARPDVWSFYERAKLHADNGDDDLAKEDIAAGLELDAEHSELLWLEKQMKKSKSARFKTPPPSASK